MTPLVKLLESGVHTCAVAADMSPMIRDKNSNVFFIDDYGFG
jgi:hypothetical protein